MGQMQKEVHLQEGKDDHWMNSFVFRFICDVGYMSLTDLTDKTNSVSG